VPVDHYDLICIPRRKNSMLLNKSLFVSVLCLLLGVLISASVLHAQTAAITGTVTEPSGAVVPGATITVRNTATNAVRTMESNSVGSYRIENLVPGIYEISAEKSGFKKLKYAAVTLTVAQVLTVDLPLELGEVVETLEVSGQEIPPIELSTAQLSNIVDSRRITDLPLITRNPYELVLLSPGTMESNTRLGGFSINGSRERNNNFLLDGTDNNDTDVPGGGSGFSALNPDSTAEFRVITSSFLPEYGRNTGAIIDIVSKSGSNDLHGDAYWFGRYNATAARDFFNPTSETEHFVRNLFGYSAGGPLKKDKTFWFVNQEFRRFRTNRISESTVPTPEFKTGRFTFDELPVDVSTPTSPNNLFGLALDPTIQKILALYPNPNGEKVDDVRGIYRFTSPIKDNGNDFTARIDHQLTPRHSLSGRYTYNSGDYEDPDDFLPGLGGFTENFRTQNVTLGLTSTFSATLINEFRFGYNRVNVPFHCAGVDVFDSFGSKDAVGRGRDYLLPGLSDSAGLIGFGCIQLGDSNGQGRATGTTHFRDNFTWIHGKHTLKFGGEVRLVYSNGFSSFFSRSAPDFSIFSNFGQPATTSLNPNNPDEIGSTTLQDMIWSLFGAVGFETQSQFFNKSAGRTADDLRGFRQRELNFFAQDSFKISPSLTFNFGVRYQFNGVPFEVNNNLSTLFANPAGPAPFTFDIVGPGSGNKLYENNLKDWEPRVGIAWDPFKKGKTSIRAGYGLFHDRVFGNLLSNSSANPPFQQDYFNIPANIPFDTVTTLALPPTQTASATVEDGAGIAAVLFDHNLRTPYSQSWNLGIQQELFTNLTIEMNYVGTKGTKIFRSVDPNPPQPALVQQLVQYCSNPNNAAGCSVADLQFTNLRFGSEFGVLPFNAVFNNALGGSNPAIMNTTQANSNYQALQANVTKRLSHGLQIQGAYTWSHAIDDAGDPIDPAENNRSLPRDPFNIRGERGNSDFDVTQRLAINYVWELPFGRGRALLKEGVIGKILEGWQLAGITTFSSGIPFDIFGNIDTEHTTLSSRVDYLGTPNPANAVTDQDPRLQTGPRREFFDIAPFGRAGNLGKNRFRGPGVNNFDAVISKRTSLGERVKLETRFEFFNVWNRVHFDQPGNLFQDPGTFGISTSQIGRSDGTSGARQLQFAMRLTF
jgi:hypothetical protein